MDRLETFIPVFRHGQFDGPGAQNRTFDNFVRSLSDESKTYPLTELGKSQILEAVRELPNYRQIDLIVASEFLRTQQSAGVIAKEIRDETGRDVEILITPLLNTIWMPPDSLSEAEFIELEQTGIRNAVADAVFKKWADAQIGESPEMVEARIDTFLLYLKEIKDNKSLTQPIVITHASFASAMQRYIQGLNLTIPRNEEQILQVAGYYFLVGNGGLTEKNFSINLLREKFLIEGS